MIDRVIRRFNRLAYYATRRASSYFYSSLNWIPLIRKSGFPAVSLPPLCFVFPESDPYVFDLFWRRLLTPLSEVAAIHVIRLPHISTGQNISDAQCEELVSNFTCMHSFLEEEYNAMSVSSYPDIPIHSLCSLLSRDILFRLHQDISLSSADQLAGYRWRNLPVGSFLSTDLSLSRKRDSVESVEDLNFCRLTLFFAVSACIAFERLHSRHSFCQLAINNCYTFNLALKSFADILGLPVVNFWSRSNDPGHVAVYTNLKSDIFLRRALASSPASFASASTIVDFCFGYLRSKLVKRNSTQIYSPLGDKALRLSVAPPDSRYITYFTSSPDELRTSDSISSLEPLFLKESSCIFSSEFHVIRHLSRFCFEHRIALVVRIHPRLGREARSGFRHESSSLSAFTALEQELATLGHVTFVQPYTPICSYSLGRYSLANVFWWSTIGIELAMLGAPCMPALADQPPGLGIRYHCFADRLPASIQEWDQSLSELVSFPRFDQSFVLQACSDFYFSIGYGFIDLSSIGRSELLASFLLGTSIQEPQPSIWDAPSSSALQAAMNNLFDDLEA